MGYNGLLMGCAREYWSDILRKLYREFGNQPFQWSTVYSRIPSITKSNLTRLKSSEWIRMVGKNKKTGMWALSDGAVRFCRDVDMKRTAGDLAKRQVTANAVMRRVKSVGHAATSSLPTSTPQLPLAMQHGVRPLRPKTLFKQR